MIAMIAGIALGLSNRYAKNSAWVTNPNRRPSIAIRGPRKYQGRSPSRPVGDDVERRRAPRVGPARRPQEGEGAVDGRPHDEVEEEEAQTPVAGDVPLGSVRDVPAGTPARSPA